MRLWHSDETALLHELYIIEEPRGNLQCGPLVSRAAVKALNLGKLFKTVLNCVLNLVFYGFLKQIVTHSGKGRRFSH
jgi:hypothetical protein